MFGPNIHPDAPLRTSDIARALTATTGRPWTPKMVRDNFLRTGLFQKPQGRHLTTPKRILTQAGICADAIFAGLSAT